LLEITVRHTIHCNAERHWALYLDPDWFTRLVIDGLGFPSCKVTPTRRSGSVLERSMDVIPKVDLPRAVAKLFGDKMGYTETGSYDESTGLWKWTTRLNVLSDKVRMGGEARLEPQGDDKVLRVAKMFVDAKIFGVGGALERAAEKDMRKGWDNGAAYMNAWLAKNPE